MKEKIKTMHLFLNDDAKVQQLQRFFRSRYKLRKLPSRTRTVQYALDECIAFAEILGDRAT